MQGEFVDDMQHGTGEAFLAATGITFSGEFTCGEPVVVPERLYCTSPPPPDMSVKNPSFPEVTYAHILNSPREQLSGENQGFGF
jgi:hypothetical protein